MARAKINSGLIALLGTVLLGLSTWALITIIELQTMVAMMQQELLSLDNHNNACDFIKQGLPSTYEANCWVAQNSGSMDISGFSGSPIGNSVTSYLIIQDSGIIWSISLDVWSQGGGAI